MDVQCSLDEQWRALLSEETRLDVGDTLLKRLGEDAKAKGDWLCDRLFNMNVHVCDGCGWNDGSKVVMHSDLSLSLLL